MKKSERDRALDFEKIRRRKRLRRRRKIALIVAAAILVLAAAGTLLVRQVFLVTDQERDFWGNFSVSHGLRSDGTEESGG